MDNTSNNPVTFPAGSFEREDLDKALDAVATASPEDRGAVISEELAKVNQRVHEDTDVGLVEGNKYVDHVNEDLGITERIQVADVEKPVLDKDVPVMDTDTPKKKASTTTASTDAPAGTTAKE